MSKRSMHIAGYPRSVATRDGTDARTSLPRNFRPH